MISAAEPSYMTFHPSQLSLKSCPSRKLSKVTPVHESLSEPLSLPLLLSFWSSQRASSNNFWVARGDLYVSEIQRVHVLRIIFAKSQMKFWSTLFGLLFRVWRSPLNVDHIFTEPKCILWAMLLSWVGGRTADNSTCVPQKFIWLFLFFAKFVTCRRIVAQEICKPAIRLQVASAARIVK